MEKIISLNNLSNTILEKIPELTYIGNPILRNVTEGVSFEEGINIGKKLIKTLLRYRLNDLSGNLKKEVDILFFNDQNLDESIASFKQFINQFVQS